MKSLLTFVLTIVNETYAKQRVICHKLFNPNIWKIITLYFGMPFGLFAPLAPILVPMNFILWPTTRIKANNNTPALKFPTLFRLYWENLFANTDSVYLQINFHLYMTE